MKKLLIALTLLTSMSSFAGSFQIRDTGMLEETKVLFANIQNDGLNLMGKDREENKSVCTISLSVLNQLNVDPVILGDKILRGDTTIKCLKNVGSGKYTVDSVNDFFIFL